MHVTRRALLAFLPLAILAAACDNGTGVTDPHQEMFGANGPQGTSRDPTGPGNNSTSSAMLSLVNQARQAAGLSALTHNSKLDAAAALLCQEIAQTGVSSHDQPGTKYPEPADRLAAVGYTWSMWGENLITWIPDLTTTEAFNDWMNSPDHRANIMNPSFTEYGDAVGSGGTQGQCWAQDFGTP